MNEDKNEQKNKAVILIIEDHSALRDSLLKWLTTVFPESEFLEGKNSEEALAIMSNQLPDVVLMDIKLPETDGIETTRRIKKKYPETQVVMLSMYDAEEYRSSAEAAGASVYIPKHKMYVELIPALKTLLSGKGNP